MHILITDKSGIEFLVCESVISLNSFHKDRVFINDDGETYINITGDEHRRIWRHLCPT